MIRKNDESRKIYKEISKCADGVHALNPGRHSIP